MMQLAHSGNISSLFLCILSPTTCKFIVECTKSYTKTDWVVATPRLDHDENITWRPIHTIVHLQAGAQVPDNAWHRWNPAVGDSEFDITPDLVLAWLGMVW